MLDVILQYISENYPLLLLIVVIIFVVWIIAKFYYTRFKHTEKKVENLPCAERKMQMDRINDKHNDLIRQISDDLIQIKHSCK